MKLWVLKEADIFITEQNQLAFREGFLTCRDDIPTSEDTVAAIRGAISGELCRVLTVIPILLAYNQQYTT
jgi:hypothetical protein